MTEQTQSMRMNTTPINKRLYSYGLPFSEKTGETLDSQMKRIKSKKASMILIDGGIGEGKTTLSVELADYINGGEINFSKQLALGGDEFQEKLRICFDLKLPVLVYDEAGDFNSRGALTSFNRQLNRIFDTYRAFKIIVIVVLPNFAVLDQSLFDKQIPRVLIHCHNRKNQGNYSVYSLKRMMYIKHKMKKIVVPFEAYRFTTPNHRGHFLDIAQARSIMLDKRSTAGKLDIITENVLKNQGLLTYQEISRKVKRSVDWTRRTISNKGLKHTQTYKKKKYFDNSVVDILVDERR